MTTRTLPGVDAIRAYLRPFDFFWRYASGPEEGEAYVDEHALRFRATLDLFDDVPGGARVLELGAVPYYMTILMTRVLGLRVDPISLYEVEGARTAVHEVRSAADGERHAFPHVSVNVERDPFPFDDGGHDVVTCCELLEHLLVNPSHALSEAHRVLRPGGLLVISTPNVLRWSNVLALLRGRNIYDRYHGNGIYGRHNREYTLDEVVMLAEGCGFSVERAETRSVMAAAAGAGVAAEAGREDTIFVRARADRQRRMACPDALYALTDEYRNVLRPAITMGIDEMGQIGRGWYELEFDGERGCRWSHQRAFFYLRPSAGRTITLEVCCHHPAIASEPVGVTLAVNGRPAGARQIDAWGWREIDFDVDAAPTGSVLECVLEVSRTWCPRDEGGTDGRRLGVRVSRIMMC
jgi:SAM-dependent methyltransferase